MKDSMTYQKILADGREEGERLLFLKLARRRLGEPDERTLARIEAASGETIEQWAEEIHKVKSWPELVQP